MGKGTYFHLKNHFEEEWRKNN